MIIINGQTIDAPDNSVVSVIDGVVTINGKQVTESKQVKIEVVGSLISLSVKNGNAFVTGDCGSIKCEDDLVVKGNVTGDIESKGDVLVKGNVGGDVDAHGDVECQNVTGSVDANGDVVMKAK